MQAASQNETNIFLRRKNYFYGSIFSHTDSSYIITLLCKEKECLIIQ